MPNANVNLPYNTPKQIRVAGKNAANTSERPITGITFTKSSATVTVVPTADPQVFTVTNTSQSVNSSGTIFWSAQNELGNPITGQTPFTQQPPDPATTIETTEL